MKASTAVRKPELVLQGSGLLPHAAIHSVADGAAPTHDGAQFGQEFSQVPAHAADLAEPCPVTPRRCPFGGACHTCPARVQAKLAISRPDDEYEQEADRVAETVMRMPAPEEEDKGPCRQPGYARTVQRQAADGVTQSAIPPVVHEVLRSPGRPLDAATRAFMEPRLRHDFGHVRVHTDAKAAESARAVNALAYTVKRDVVFGQEQYTPETSRGRKLLIHELTHVVQQMFSGTAHRIQRKACGHDNSVTGCGASLGRWLLISGEMEKWFSLDTLVVQHGLQPHFGGIWAVQVQTPPNPIKGGEDRGHVDGLKVKIGHTLNVEAVEIKARSADGGGCALATKEVNEYVKSLNVIGPQVAKISASLSKHGGLRVPSDEKPTAEVAL